MRPNDFPRSSASQVSAQGDDPPPSTYASSTRTHRSALVRMSLSAEAPRIANNLEAVAQEAASMPHGLYSCRSALYLSVAGASRMVIHRGRYHKIRSRPPSRKVHVGRISPYTITDRNRIRQQQSFGPPEVKATNTMALQVTRGSSILSKVSISNITRGFIRRGD